MVKKHFLGLVISGGVHFRGLIYLFAYVYMFMTHTNTSYAISLG